jgi:hypothetical protein
MAATHGKDAYFQWNSVSLHPFCNDISFPRDIDTVETTTMGDANKEYIVGLKNGSFSISGIWEAGASSVDATLGDALGTSAAFEYRANSAAVGVSNPKYTGTALLTSYEQTAGTGDAVAFSAEFMVTGAVTRATA